MIDPYTLKVIARVSVALLAAGTLCQVLRRLTESMNSGTEPVWSERTPDHWRFVSLVLNTVGLLLAALVAQQVARLW